MELTRENFDDFLMRLRHHNEGEGVNEHGTANPIFIVQKLELVTGIDPEYSADGHFWVNCDGEGEYDNSEVVAELNDYVEAGGVVEPCDLDEDDEVRVDGEVLFQRIYYVKRWDYVCAHFTKEAAEAFIARKQHDYRQLRVYVDSQYWCWEFNAIIKGLLSGKIGFNG